MNSKSGRFTWVGFLNTFTNSIGFGSIDGTCRNFNLVGICLGCFLVPENFQEIFTSNLGCVLAIVLSCIITSNLHRDGNGFILLQLKEGRKLTFVLSWLLFFIQRCHPEGRQLASLCLLIIVSTDSPTIRGVARIFGFFNHFQINSLVEGDVSHDREFVRHLVFFVHVRPVQQLWDAISLFGKIPKGLQRFTFSNWFVALLLVEVMN
eukprot:Lithocolla_globosa_v1_NODE_41_length_8221_cov_7.943914.p4 type:complete len:207 gc:universal NODE_41_length_8221_cov_7.943914:2928-3548(+)